MYSGIVIALLFVFPILSASAEVALRHTPVSVEVLLRWFVFWGVGVRLLSAGISQIMRPRYTAETILGLQRGDAQFVVRELGFSNTALGVVDCLSLGFTNWISAAAVAGAIFYAFAGVNHKLQGKHTVKETVAMFTDLGFAIVIAVLSVMAWPH
jgi:hypothetical protein